MAAGGVHQLRDHVVQRLALDVVEVDQREVGLLARLDRADAIAEAQRDGTAERRRAQRAGGVEGRGIVGNGLGQQRGGARLADHVEVVVARAAVGTDAEGDARTLEPANGAEA